MSLLSIRLKTEWLNVFFAARSKAKAQSRYLPVAVEAEPTFRLLVKSGVTADEQEVQSNPRARSARLRIGVRTGAEPTFFDEALFGLPDISGFGGNRK